MQNHRLQIAILVFFFIHTLVNSKTTYNDYNPLFMFAINNPTASGSEVNMNVRLSSGNPDIWMQCFMEQSNMGYFRQDCHPALIFVNVNGFNKSYLFFDKSREPVIKKLDGFFNNYKRWMSFMSFNIDKKESIQEQLAANIYTSKCSKTPIESRYFSGNNAISEFENETSYIFQNPINFTNSRIMTVYLDLQIDQLDRLLKFMKDDNTPKSNTHHVLVFIFSTHSSIRSQADEDTWEIDLSDSHFFDLYSITSPSIWMIFMGVFILLSLIVFAILWISRIQVPYYSFKRD